MHAGSEASSRCHGDTAEAATAAAEAWCARYAVVLLLLCFPGLGCAAVACLGLNMLPKYLNCVHYGLSTGVVSSLWLPPGWSKEILCGRAPRLRRKSDRYTPVCHPLHALVRTLGFVLAVLLSGKPSPGGSARCCLWFWCVLPSLFRVCWDKGTHPPLLLELQGSFVGLAKNQYCFSELQRILAPIIASRTWAVCARGHAAEAPNHSLTAHSNGAPPLCAPPDPIAASSQPGHR